MLKKVFLRKISFLVSNTSNRRLCEPARRIAEVEPNLNELANDGISE
jgi:hypothetical protein